jgi:hypothetical protein
MWKFNSFGEKKFEQRWGIILEGLDFENRGRIVLFVPVFKLIRELCLVLYLVLLLDYPAMQIMLNLYFTMAALVIVG